MRYLKMASLALASLLAACGSALPSPLTLDAHSGLISGIDGLPVGTYPDLQLEAVVTVAGASHVYTQPALTLTLLPQGS